MKKTMMMLVAGGMLLASCNSKQPEGAATETGTETMNSEPKELNVKLADLSDPKDHVCGMELTEGGIADTLHHDGKVYGFCAPECKAEFAKNPSQYLAN